MDSPSSAPVQNARKIKVKVLLKSSAGCAYLSAQRLCGIITLGRLVYVTSTFFALQLAMIDDIVVRLGACGLTEPPEALFRKRQLKELVLSQNLLQVRLFLVADDSASAHCQSARPGSKLGGSCTMKEGRSFEHAVAT
jgi:hypothetical protein